MVWSCFGLVGVLSAVDHAGLFGRQAPDRERFSNAEARVTNAISFDTIEVELTDGGQASTRVRLHGVAPLPVGDDRRLGERLSDEALAFVKRYAVGKPITLALDPVRRTRDREGRLLAYVYRADTGELLNQMLIDRGFAAADARTDHVLKFEFTQKAERAAKARVGLWAQLPVRQASQPEASAVSEEAE